LRYPFTGSKVERFNVAFLTANPIFGRYFA